MKKHKIKLICKQCKKEYEVIYCRRKISKFCSNTCKRTSNIDKKILHKYYCIRGLSIRQIAKNLKKDRHSISKLLKIMGDVVTPIPNYNKIITKKKLKYLHYKKHLTLIQIAKYYRCFRSTITIYMKKFKLKIIGNIKGKKHIGSKKGV